MLIIDEAHERMFHGGTQVTLNYIRRSYWIIGGRAPVRSHILKCGWCARYRGTRAQQLMGQLPSARATVIRPFYNKGLDYAGPVTLKTWKRRAALTKAIWLYLYVSLHQPFTLSNRLHNKCLHCRIQTVHRKKRNLRHTSKWLWNKLCGSQCRAETPIRIVFQGTSSHCLYAL